MKAKKSLGQNFLSNPKILSKIIDVNKIQNNDIILEIGPGTGIVVEKDNNLSNILIEKYGSKIHVINKDILEC